MAVEATQLLALSLSKGGRGSKVLRPSDKPRAGKLSTRLRAGRRRPVGLWPGVMLWSDGISRDGGAQGPGDLLDQLGDEQLAEARKLSPRPRTRGTAITLFS